MAEVRKSCGVCAYSWLDKYNKPICPKCQSPLTGVASKRAPGEVSTFKAKASDACESSSGTCPKGGAHQWKYGKCNACGMAEGYAKERTSAGTRPPGGACTDGKMHVFKFAKCTKCGVGETAGISVR